MIGASAFSGDRLFLDCCGGGEDALGSRTARDERQTHDGIDRSAFNDRAAGFNRTFFLGFVNHADGDPIF